MINPNVTYYVKYQQYFSVIGSREDVSMTFFIPNTLRGFSDKLVGLHLALTPNSDNIFSYYYDYPNVVNKYFNDDNEFHTVSKTNVILRDPKTGRFLSYKQLREECSEQFKFIADLPNTPWSNNE